MTESDEHVTEYLRELDQALAGLPRSRRREVVDGIAARITSAGATGAGVRETFGEPAEIAAAARARFGLGPDPASWREVATLFLLPVGGLVVPVLGWLVGVVLLWGSDAWTRGDKLIGTLVIPGGLLLPFALVAALTVGPLGIAAVVVLFLAPLASALYLARRLARSRPR
jgi:hypothetical protein